MQGDIKFFPAPLYLIFEFKRKIVLQMFLSFLAFLELSQCSFTAYTCSFNFVALQSLA